MSEDWNRRSFLSTTAVAAGATAAALALGTAPARARDNDDHDDHDREGSQAPLRVLRTTVEHAETLLGCDVAKPRFSWELSAEGRRGAEQSAYQIRTAYSASDLVRSGRLVWDSGRVKSDRSVDVIYDGPALKPRTRYHWQVRVWDEKGRPSSWSPVRWWETALPEDGFKGLWIGPAGAVRLPPFDGASWIWSAGATVNSAPPGARWFRGSFTLPEGAQVAKAGVVVTADDDFTLYLDGEQIAHQPQQPDAWKDGKFADITERLKAGSRVQLAAVATNRGNNPAGLLVRLLVEDETGARTAEFVTDDDWKVSEQEQQDWTEPAFDDSSWAQAAVVAPYGEGPWTRGAGLPLAEETPAPLLRREFTVTKNVDRARLYISGLAYYEAQINGERVGKQVLDPGFTAYDETVLYSVHDVTDDIRRGRNAIGVSLGRGFYGLLTPNAWDWGNAYWSGEPRLLAQLEIRHTDGSTTTLSTDEDWRITDGPTRSNSLYAGETYDAREEPAGWTLPDFDDRGWSPALRREPPKGKLRPQLHEPIEIIETVRPKVVKEVAPGVYLLDMERTMSGWCRLTVRAAAGTKVTLAHGEKLAGGRVVATSGFTPGRFQTDEYVCAGTGEDEVWEPRFSYKGFRYVEVSGLPARPEPGQVEGRVVHSALREASEFDCSLDRYVQMDRAMRRTLANNLHGIPTDTPTYEKNGWTGDANVAVPAMLHSFDMQRFFTKWLNDLRDSQDEAGRVPSIVPNGGWGFTPTYNPAPEWTTVYPLLLWEMHRAYGDERLAREHFAPVVKYLDWELGRRKDGLVSSTLGDYLAPGPYFETSEESRSLTGTAYLYRSLQAVAELADAIDEKAQGERLRAAAQDIKTAFNQKFLTSAGHYRTSGDRGYEQTNNCVPLAFGLVPDDTVPKVVASLVQDIKSPLPAQQGAQQRQPNTLGTGALGTSVLLPQLTAHGHADVAHTVATQTAYPSWGNWFDNGGADTMWEYWEVDRNRSQNHFFKGTVVDWLHQNVVGLRPGEGGYRTFTVRPDARGGVDWARTSLRTVRGEVAVSWKTESDTLRLSVRVPVGSTAEVHVPAPDKAKVTAHDDAKRIRLDNGFAVYRVPQGDWEFVSRS
ncbi:family 78 glycoside hydrolase catalytic domain [Streptomyces sp. NPDC008343]|uniref:family 78 glycoside hydrolase catalytic domain n=1 Tax=Streptomyces sp. NPDC008343 TaxID=3364828 RepID=UPI0036E17D00